MASDNKRRGKKRSKAFYRKCAYGAKKHCSGLNILEPGIRGFLVMCNHDERSAVRESYNILNEYADILYGPDKSTGSSLQQEDTSANDKADEEDCDDIEKALEKEVEELKAANSSTAKRFQNVSTKTKNCVFIRTTLENPTKVTLRIMEDIAEKHLRKARYAARILPIIGTCKANTKEIEKLAFEVLTPVFSKESDSVPSSCTILFKMRNNQGTSCGRESVIPAVTNVLKDINPDVIFSWTDYSSAVIIEIVCTVCCLGYAPDYNRLRKYNLQELQQGPRERTQPSEDESIKQGSDNKGEAPPDNTNISNDGNTVENNSSTGDGSTNGYESVKEKNIVAVREETVNDVNENEETSNCDDSEKLSSIKSGEEIDEMTDSVSDHVKQEEDEMVSNADS